MLVVEVTGLSMGQCGVGGYEQVLMKESVTKAFESEVLKVGS